VFCGDEIVAFAQSRAHFNDIGGMRARLAVARSAKRSFRKASSFRRR
jgi:N-methylhydantoinase B/oxoprolinase/acetone carboxylase alpha subunit